MRPHLCWIISKRTQQLYREHGDCCHDIHSKDVKLYPLTRYSYYFVPQMIIDWIDIALFFSGPQSTYSEQGDLTNHHRCVASTWVPIGARKLTTHQLEVESEGIKESDNYTGGLLGGPIEWAWLGSLSSFSPDDLYIFQNEPERYRQPGTWLASYTKLALFGVFVGRGVTTLLTAYFSVIRHSEFAFIFALSLPVT